MVDFFAPQSQGGFFEKNNSKEIARRRKMAERLMKQGEQDGSTQIVSGYAVKKSPLEGLAKALTSGIGQYQERKADTMQSELDKKRAELMAQAVEAYGQDPTAASKILMQDPEMSSEAMKMAMSGMDAQREAASKERDWQRDADLKRELAMMRGRGSGSGGGITVDPDTGEISVIPDNNMNPFAGSGNPAMTQDYSNIAPAISEQDMMSTFSGGRNMPPQAPNMMSQPIDSKTAMANKIGVPYKPLTAKNMTPKDASTFARNTQLSAQKRLEDPDFLQALSKARGNIADTNRLTDLMDVQDTGGVLINTPLIGSAMKKFDPELNEMQSIQDRLTPQQRVAGSGATSDFDAKMFQNALPSPDKPKATNENIIKAIQTRENDTLNYQSFLSDYLDVNGHLNGADKYWQEYINNNPIFDPTKNDMTLNANRMDYKSYFGGSGGATPQQPDMGGQMSFNTLEEAEAANLPVGTVIMIGGRKAVIE